MKGNVKILNELLVETFNDILIIEQNAFKGTPYENLSVTEIHTIEAIGIAKPRTMSEVAADLKITVGTLTTAINNLVKKGYVERKRIEEDRRVVLIELTHDGKVVYKLHEKFHSNMIKATIEGIEPEQEKVLIESLERLNKFFREKCGLVKENKKE